MPRSASSTAAQATGEPEWGAHGSVATCGESAGRERMVGLGWVAWQGASRPGATMQTQRSPAHTQHPHLAPAVVGAFAPGVGAPLAAVLLGAASVVVHVPAGRVGQAAPAARGAACRALALGRRVDEAAGVAGLAVGACAAGHGAAGGVGGAGLAVKAVVEAGVLEGGAPACAGGVMDEAMDGPSLQ